MSNIDPTADIGPVWIQTDTPQRTADQISAFKIWITVDPLPVPGYKVTLTCTPPDALENFPQEVAMPATDYVIRVTSKPLTDPLPISITAGDGRTERTRELTL